MRLLLSVLSTVLLVSPVARAGTLVLDIIENPSNTGTVGTQSLGWQFQVNTSILVDGLAFWGSGITQNHDVGIYDDTSQNLLLSTTVLSTDPLSGTGPWRVHAISSFLLAPGIYDIAAETGTDKYTSAPNSMFTSPSITFLEDRFAFGSPTLTYPNASSGGGLQAWFGPSFTATNASAAPEPASFGLFGMGLLVVGRFVRRRRA